MPFHQWFCILVLSLISLAALATPRVDSSANTGNDAVLTLTPPLVKVEPLYEPVFDSETFVYTAGNSGKPALLLVHGIGASGAGDWQAVIQQLQDDYYLIAVDLPGFGQTTPGDALYSPENYSQFLEYITNRYFSERPFSIVGHSMGAAVALHYAATYPDRIHHLVTIDTAGLLHHSQYVAYLSQLGVPDDLPAADAGQELLGDLLGSVMSELELYQKVDIFRLLKIDRLRRTILGKNPTAIAGAALVATDFSQTLRNINTPTLVLWGEQDQIAPLRTGQMLSSVLPNAQLRTQPDAAHVPLRSHAFWVAEQIDMFIQNHPAGQHPAKPVGPVSPANADARCKNETDFSLRGHYRHIELVNCQRAVLHHVTADSIRIIDSNVHIINGILGSLNQLNSNEQRTPSTTLDVSDSTIKLTGGQVFGNTAGQPAIRSANSQWDVYGSQIKVPSGLAITATGNTASQWVFSVAEVQQRFYHDVIELQPQTGL